MHTEYCGQRQTHKKEVINCTKIIIAESFQSGQGRDSINKYMKREEKRRRGRGRGRGRGRERGREEGGGEEEEEEEEEDENEEKMNKNT